MHQLLKSEIVPITKEYVSYFSSLPVVGGDRKRESRRGKRRIAQLRAKLQDGIFHTPKWAVAVLNGVTYRVNGGHSSLMLEELNGEFPSGMVANVDTFQCEHRVDLADLFRQFDPKEGARTAGEVVDAAKAVYPVLSDISITNVRRAADSLARHGRYILDRVVSTDEKIRLVHHHVDFILFADQFLSLKSMQKIGIRVALVETYEKSPPLALEFWAEVKNESNSDPESGSRKLAEFMRIIMNPVNNSQILRGRLECTYAKAIHAANQFKRGGKTNLCFHSKLGPPKLRW